MNEASVKKLLRWYEENKRPLPWRENKDPYRIWVSEIMLQQTRIEAVKPYYARFTDKYPDVSALASANEDELIRIWEGLGYYSRVRNMHKAAMEVENKFGGNFPVSYEVLLTLPGIGEYTAGAVASIAADEKVPAIDGNVLRVYTRFHADRGNISKNETKTRIRKDLQDTIDAGDFSAGDFNSALMELGEVICIPKGGTVCEGCPLGAECRAKKAGTVDSYPVKDAKAARRIEERTVFLLTSTKGTGIRKRENKGLLAGMYEFPSVQGHLSQNGALSYIKSLGYHPVKIDRLEESVHIFSHLEWHMTAYRITVDDITDPVKEDEENRIFFVTGKERESGYALPEAFRAYKKYIE